MKSILKRVRFPLILIGLVYLISVVIILAIRLPSYSMSTTGKLYIVNKVSRTVQVIDLSNGREVALIPIHMESHQAITTHLQNKVVLSNYGATDSEGNMLKVIDTKTNKIEKTILLNDSISVNGIVPLLEPNKVVLVDYKNNALLLLNLLTGITEKQLSTEQIGSHLAVKHPTRPLFYVTDKRSTLVSVVNLETKTVAKQIPCGSTTESVAITPDGSEIWVTHKEKNTITVLDALTYNVIKVLATGEEPLKVKFSVDGKYGLVTNAMDGNIFVYDRETKSKVKTIILHGKTTLLERVLYHTPYPVNILMHPNGLYAFVSNSNANKVEVIDMKTFSVVSTIGTGEIPDALTLVE